MASRTHMTMRVDPTLPERIDALCGVVGASSTSDGARKLLELGMRVAAGDLPAPPPRPEPTMGADEAVAVLDYLRRALAEQLEVVAQHRPVGAMAGAIEIGTGLVQWAEGLAGRSGTTIAELLAAKPTAS